jgi:hypothetical protein
MYRGTYDILWHFSSNTVYSPGYNNYCDIVLIMYIYQGTYGIIHVFQL